MPLEPDRPTPLLARSAIVNPRHRISCSGHARNVLDYIDQHAKPPPILKVQPDQGHAILTGRRRSFYIPTSIIDTHACPHQPGDTLRLHFPEVALDSYRQPILGRDGQPRYIHAHDARLHVTGVTVDHDPEVDDSGVFEVHFRLDYPDVDLWLARGGGLTANERLAVEDGGTYVDPELLRPEWGREARDRWADCRGAHAAAREMAQRLRAA